LKDRTMEELVAEVKSLRQKVSELEGLKKRISSRNKEILAVNKELESFSYSVSHDLRAPLRTIIGFSQALFEDYSHNLDEKGKDYINRICDAGHHMGMLIDDLLNLSRVTQTEMEFNEVNMSLIVQSILMNFHRKDPERIAEFIITSSATVKGDNRLLAIALENLLNNAWKFTSGKLHARIEFGVKKDGDDNIYFIKDNGKGFDMKYSDKLFIAFQRLHGEEEFPGTGIGLATVQRIIHRHGGRIWAEGKVNEGATFYFTIG